MRSWGAGVSALLGNGVGISEPGDVICMENLGVKRRLRL